MKYLPGSTPPNDLRRFGHIVEADGEGERILPGAITEQFVVDVNGELVAADRDIDAVDHDDCAARGHLQSEAVCLQHNAIGRIDPADATVPRMSHVPDLC